eukprot:223395-Rhodomonas_salina.1
MDWTSMRAFQRCMHGTSGSTAAVVFAVQITCHCTVCTPRTRSPSGRASNQKERGKAQRAGGEGGSRGKRGGVVCR